MASVSSLDKDLRKMRLDKYTPAAAKEVQSWIERVLGERLPSGDLLEGLKDGVALCKLVNLAVGPPGVKFKKSAMPFVQMENISHFLRACQAPPLNLPDHDMFLTVDLYEQKDPAQVLQCLGAFSRAACSANPSSFPSAIGARNRGGSVLSPQSTGPSTPRGRGMSNASTTSPGMSSRPALVTARTGGSGSGRWSPTKSPPAERVGSPTVSSWSKKNHEGVTSPAWNIAQYGYMGGASQGNLGIAFGGRRQITSASPHVPNLAEKERRRKEQEAEAERQRLQMEEQQRMRQAELEAEEERARIEEERKWEEETRRLRAEEKRQAEEEKRRWEEEERQWKLTEEKRRQEEEEAERKMAEERHRPKSRGDSRLQGQFLSQYQAEQQQDDGGYADRVKQLEEELELARQREREYEEERQKRAQRREASKSRARSRSRPRLNRLDTPPTRQDSWAVRDEREFLAKSPRDENPPPPPPRPLPVPQSQPVKTHRTGETQPLKAQRTGEGRPLPAQSQPQPLKAQRTGEGRPLPVPGQAKSQTPSGFNSPFSRPLPVPSPAQSASRTDRFLAKNPAPAPKAPQQTYSRELGATAERDEEDRRRVQSQAKTKAGGWAGKSLLEREMEMERQRQQEWEESQKETAKAARSGDGVDGIGGGIGGRWDVGQWSGFTGGDSQNKGGQGIGAGRRQIVGPRPLPGRP
ncbi:hypothetical protein F5Y15DRAFT_389551 [Xylariaceae sp. FL0016]|nr:hypothetical protein F5Y15DRAFT_389551 [Xylariaceae sp. FL0016]